MPGSNAGFQTFVNRNLPVAAPGDWAGANIRASVPVGPWALVAPPAGTTVGVIAWADPNAGIASNYFRPNSFSSFIHREQQALITSFLALATQQIPQGFPVTALARGDFWGIFTAGCSVGQKVYANPTTGALTGAATGGSVIAAISAGGGSVTAGVLTTVDADASGSAIAVGQIVVDSGGNLPPGTYIASAAGTGSGTHLWNLANLDNAAIPNVSAGSLTWNLYGAQETQFFCMQNVAAAASFTATLAASPGQGPFGVLTVSAIASGVLLKDQWIQSAGTVPVPLTANIQIIEQLTGTAGSTGTYLVSNTIAVASGQTFTTYNGQLAKISSWATWL